MHYFGKWIFVVLHLPCGDVGILARVQGTVEFLVGLVTDGEILAIHLQFDRIVLDSGGKQRSRFGNGCYSKSCNLNSGVA